MQIEHRHKGGMRGWTAGRGQIMQDIADHVKNLLFYLKLLRGQNVLWVIFMDTEIIQCGGSSAVEKTFVDESSP